MPPAPTGQLDDASRTKLDGIVQQMQTNKESDQNIQAVVNDFKTKYSGGPPPPPATSPSSQTPYADLIPHVDPNNVNRQNPLQVVGSAFANIPHELGSAVENIAHVPGAIYDTVTDPNVRAHPLAAAQGFGQSLYNQLGKPLVQGATTIGNTVMGAVQAGVKKATGLDVGNKATSQAFQNAPNNAYNAVDTFTKGLISNPLATTGMTVGGLKQAGMVKGDAISSAARPAINTAKAAVAPLAKPIAGALRTSAQESIQKALGPTTLANKAIAAKLAPQILDRPFSETSALTRHGLETKAAAGHDAAGAAYDQIGPLQGNTATKPIIDALEKEKAQFTAGGQVVDPHGFKQVSDIQELIKHYGDTIDNQTLREVRQIFDKQVARTKSGFALSPAEGSAIDVKRSAANIFRDTLASDNPDLARLNKQYTFWSNLEKVIGDTNKRTAPQSGFGKDAATLAGALSGHGVLNVAINALTFRWLSSAVKSTGWRLTSARIKNSIADAISKKDFAGANKILKDHNLVPKNELNTRKSTIIPSPTNNANTMPDTIPQKLQNPQVVPKSSSSPKPTTGILEKAKQTFQDIKKNGNRGFIKLPLKQKIPQQDLATMSDFTDYAAKNPTYKLKGEAARSMEQEAADLWDKYLSKGGKRPVTLPGLASDFGRALEASNFGKKQARDTIGRFTHK